LSVEQVSSKAPSPDQPEAQQEIAHEQQFVDRVYRQLE
jgi:hypothetical protein